MPQPPPPEPKPALLSLSAKDLQLFLSSPGAVLVLLALAAAPGLVGVLMPRAQQEAQAPVPAAELDTPPAWAVDVRGPALAALASVAVNELPPAIPSQRLHPHCDPDLERSLRGACWVPVDVRPCPKGKAYVNDKGPEADGKCYARGMKAARSPTSGEPRPLGVADP